MPGVSTVTRNLSECYFSALDVTEVECAKAAKSPFSMEMAAILVHRFHCAPKWPPWQLPNCCYAVTSYANTLLL